MKQTAAFWCEDDALRFLQQRNYTGRQHGISRRERKQLATGNFDAGDTDNDRGKLP